MAANGDECSMVAGTGQYSTGQTDQAVRLFFLLNNGRDDGV